LPTYIAEPPSGTPPKGIVVIIPDAFGWELPNSRVLADSYAEKGNFRVYLPDFMNGHWLRHDLLTNIDQVTGAAKTWWDTANKVLPGLVAIANFVPFVWFCRQSVATPRIVKFLSDMRANEAASLPVGTAGFCWGGKFVTILCADTEKAADGKSLIDAGFTAHPSGLAIPSDIEAVKLPLSISVGDVDFALPVGGVKQIGEIFDKKEDKEKYELVVIPDAKHGFAVRGNPEVEKELKQGIQAEDQAVNWWTKWFEKASV